MRSYENILIQILNIFLALIPNFIFPIVLGLDVYGAYVGAIASIFFISKLSESSFDTALMMDTSGEARYSLVSIYRQIIPAKIFASILLFLLITYIQSSGVQLLVLLLLVMQLLSATSVSLLYSLNIKNKILLFLGIANVLLISLSIYFYTINASEFYVIGCMILFNFLMYVSASVIVYIGYNGKEEYKLPSNKRLAGFVMQSLGSNFLNGGIVLVSSFFYSGERLGIFKVATSVVQAATSFFPVNLKTILTVFVKNKGCEIQYTYFRNFLGVSILLFSPSFFVPLFLGVLKDVEMFAVIISPLLKFESQLYWMVPAITMFFIVMLLEKAVLAFYNLKKAVIISVVSTIINLLVAILLIKIYNYGPEFSYLLSCITYILIVSVLNIELLKSALKELLALTSLVVIYFTCLNLQVIDFLAIDLAIQVIFSVILLNRLNVIRVTEYKNTIKEKLI